MPKAPKLDTDNPEIAETLRRIAAGQVNDLECPFCHQDKLEEEGSAWGRRFACPGCDQAIEPPPDDEG